MQGDFPSINTTNPNEFCCNTSIPSISMNSVVTRQLPDPTIPAHGLFSSDSSSPVHPVPWQQGHIILQEHLDFRTSNELCHLWMECSQWLVKTHQKLVFCYISLKLFRRSLLDRFHWNQSETAFPIESRFQAHDRCHLVAARSHNLL